ncbi:hypothetical protein PVAP13_1KG322731 [Panicum virgatum]|uniref:Uncharacterized protein n=1 Tax=Panicum virgatum TaxID=38727 RepID=A0A8T0XNJ4_PANVG|nr:hypothetical protein PVAP13_1KG322731 [Panicum virgatum]
MSACHEYDYYDPDDDDATTDFEVLISLGSHGGEGWRWAALPPPRFTRDDHHLCDYSTLPRGYVRAHAVVGRAICVSSSDTHVGTHCFDTVARRWSRAGASDLLPFEGGAQYVPDRDLWLGFSSSEDGGGFNYNLCVVSDLATHLRYGGGGGGAGAGAGRQEEVGPPPKLQVGEWRDHLAVPREWRCQDPPSLINLGAGRFCVAKLFTVLRRSPPEGEADGDDDEDDDGLCSSSSWQDLYGYGWLDGQRVSHRVAVFTGVELEDDDNDTHASGGAAGMMMPRIVPHKSVSYVLDDDHADFEWVL